MAANDEQVGGNHYKKLSPQPWDIIFSWNLNFLEGNVLKYLARYKLAQGVTVTGSQKGGLEDLRKAKHYIEKILELEEAKLFPSSAS